jgi:hypothetical protein
MARTVTVKQHNSIGTIKVEDGASVGAQVGVNLYDQYGRLITGFTPSVVRVGVVTLPNQVANTAVPATASNPLVVTGASTADRLESLLRVLEAQGLVTVQ